MVKTRNMTGAKKAQVKKNAPPPPSNQQSLGQILAGDQSYAGPQRKYNKLLIALAILAVIGGSIGIYFIVKGSNSDKDTTSKPSTTKPGTSPPSSTTTPGQPVAPGSTEKPVDKKDEKDGGVNLGLAIGIPVALVLVGLGLFLGLAPQAAGFRSKFAQSEEAARKQAAVAVDTGVEEVEDEVRVKERSRSRFGRSAKKKARVDVDP